MDTYHTIVSLGASIIIGALIGIEREKKKQNSKGLSSVGIRTNILISVFGAIAAMLGQQFNPVIFLVCFIALLVLNISSYIYLLIRYERIGITTEVSTILVFLLGAMCIAGYIQIAFILAILITLVLSIREYLHNAILKLKDREFFDTLKFAIIAFIILPLLPQQNYDSIIFDMFPKTNLPSHLKIIEVLNPYNIWFLVVMISGISFLGYILVKIFGKKYGIAFSGLMGGLYSSTATSLTLATKSRELTKTSIPFIAGIVLACAISYIKTFIEIRALNEELFNRSFIPIMLMFGYLLIIGLYLMFIATKKEKITAENQFETPFKLKQAIKLGALIVFALLLTKILLTYTGVNLYYLVAGAMAFFAIDDPVVVSTSATAGKLMSYEDAKNIIIIVVYLNMVQKVALMYFFGNRKLVKTLAYIFGGLLLVTLAGLLYF